MVFANGSSSGASCCAPPEETLDENLELNAKRPKTSVMRVDEFCHMDLSYEDVADEQFVFSQNCRRAGRGKE